ncbi:MAG: hypothetical protein LBS19_05485 [Clostridiales bacterium]|nr:hypothetical protein [Clostridiales bacterium]
MISLLSRPSLLRIDYIAYEIRKASDQIIRGIRILEEQEKAADDVSGDAIDAVFDSVDRNSKSIVALLKDMGGSVGELNDTMRRKSAAREHMSEEQIQAFSSFNRYYTDRTAVLNNKLASISGGTGLESIKNEIMSDDTDYAQLYDKLNSITDNQYDAIAAINGIIRAAKDTLCALDA